VLYCGNNKLTELDVSKLVKLERLVCDTNQLTELDVSKLVNLKGLDFYNNQLTELNISNLVNLKWLNGGEYIQSEPEPEQDKLDLLISKVEQLEKIISEITKGKQWK